MTNNSPVYWTANGLSLHTQSWSVKSFGGRRFFGPSKRGSDLQVPFRQGRIWAPKSREAQAYDITMWVIPVREDGSRDPGLTREQRAHKNWRTIVAAVDVDGQFELIKRWYQDNTIVDARGVAEFLEGSGPDSDDGSGFYATMTLTMTDPYFYKPIAAQPVGNITVSGDVPTTHVIVTLNGGNNPRVTFPGGNWIQFNGAPTAPVVIDCLNGSATMGGVYVNGLISRNRKFPEWPMLKPGAQALGYTGGGSATVTYDAAYR